MTLASLPSLSFLLSLPSLPPALRPRRRPGYLRFVPLLLLLATGPLAAQEPALDAFAEVVKVEVVNVDVVVTDRSGQPVVGLSKEDFELKVDGKPVPITNFFADSIAVAGQDARPAEWPSGDPAFRTVEEVAADSSHRAHVVLLIDHTRLSASNRKRAFNALSEAVARLDDSALISVVGVEGSLVFYSDFLFDHGAVQKILDDISKVSLQTDITETERRRLFGELARGQSGGILGRSTLANDSLIISQIRSYAEQEYHRGLRSLDQIRVVAGTLAGLPGRKLLLYLGEGIPTNPGEGLYVAYRNRFSGPEMGMPHQNFNSDYTRAVGRFDLTMPMQELAEAVNRAEVTLYAIDAKGNHGGDIRSALTEQGATSEAVSVVNENYREPLEYASKATGGRLLESSGQLADQLVEMVVGLQTYYSLGFTPSSDWQEGSQHRIEVKAKMKGLQVRHREEIILPAADEREASATVAALMYQSIDNRMGFVANPAAATLTREDGQVVLPITLELPIDRLELLPRDGQHQGSVTIYVATRDRQGNPGAVQRIPFHLAIPADKIAEARGQSAHYQLPVVLRAGDRQVAIGVRDDTSGSFSSLRLEVSSFSPKL